MASPIRVKEEEAVDIFHVATDSDGDAEGEDISLEDLQQLDSKFATNPNLTKFPVGCKIWYNAKNSRAPAKLLRAKSASVVGVYMHFEKMQKVYKVRSDAPSQYDVFLYEDRLVYGMNCPVTVGNTYTNDTRDGVIVCPKLDAGNDGKQQIAYDVQITQGSNVTIEFGVAAERIKYRMEKPSVKNTTGEKEEGSGVKGLVAKESKVDCEERKELQKSNSISTNSNDVEVSALKPGVEQLEVSALPPAPSAKAASGATVAKAAAGNVAADDYAKLADMDMVHDNRKTTPREHDQYEDTKSGVKAESVEDNRKECGERNDQKLDIARWEPPSLSLQRKRSSGSDANDRPVKVSRVRTDRDESIDFLTCTLNIPPWTDQGRDFFLHLIGAGGQKTKKIESITNCWINISYPKLPSMPKPPMSITIKSKIARIPPVNVHTAICMIEESLVDFLKDANAAKRLLYELAATAIGSYKCTKNRRGGDCSGLLLREYNGLKYWLWLRDLPCLNNNHHHGKFLLQMKPVQLSETSDCKMEVFAKFGLPLDQAPPFVLISGTKQGDVKKTVAAVVNAMKEHQACCHCTPKW